MTEPVPYPKAVMFVLANEFCERFNYYGVRAVISLYINEELKFTEHEAVMIYHFFAMLIFTFPLVGAIIADSWLGKFQTVIYISVIYAVGNVMLALSAIRPLHLPPREFTIISLLLIAFGAGGIKPCVSSFGGDQFVLPQQEKQIETFFHLFYFSINAGSFLATIITPMLRKSVYCFSEHSCYSLAFGVPAAFMIAALVFFLIGKPFYKMKMPEGNMLVKISSCIGTAIHLKCKLKEVKKDHWLDFAIEKHGEKLVKEIKIVLSVLYLYIPLPLFWALFEQIATAWTFQARRMNGEVGQFFTILPDQMQVANPVLVLMFIPLLNYVVYPAFAVIMLLTTPLQRICSGGLLCSAAFVMSAFLELGLESTFPLLPTEGHGQIRIYNVLTCSVKVTCEKLNDGQPFEITKLNFFKDLHLKIGQSDSYSYTMNGECSSASGEFKVYEYQSAAFFFKEKDKPALYKEDNVDKLISGYPNVRTIVNQNGVFDKDITIKFMASSGLLYHQLNASDETLVMLNPDTYKIHFGDSFIFTQKFDLGGVYTVAAIATAKDNFNIKVLEVTAPNSIHILWMLPQYIVISIGECMFSITGVEFAYSQAPQSMKAVMQASWLLTHAVGQLVVVIIESMHIFDQQSSMFFLYAALMLIDMIIFILMTLSYKYVEQRE